MTEKSVFKPTISMLLDEFFASYKPTAGRVVRARIERVRADLAQHMEVEGMCQLTTPQVAIVLAERAFGAEDAFARTMRAAELFYVLSRYPLPQFALEGLPMRQTQLDVSAAIVIWLSQGRLRRDRLDACAVIEYDIAMRRARDAVRAARSRTSGAAF